MRPGLAVGALLTLSSCNWIATARHAIGYPTVARGEAANLAVADSVLYATLAQEGLAVLSGTPLHELHRVAPPARMESVDAVVVADGMLFALDARPPGHLAVYSLADPLAPRLLAPPRPVPVGPFSGVSAASGIAVVSGGTSRLTAWRYDRSGLQDSVPFATLDLGRGQPNALVSHDGRVIYVATHRKGPHFWLDLVRVTGDRLEPAGALELEGAGFTAGGAKPANFPIALAELGADTLLVADGAGLAVVEVSRPAAPVLRTVIPLEGSGVGLTLNGTRALVSVAGKQPALVLFDCSRGLAGPLRRIALPPGTFPLGVALIRSSIAVAARQRGVLGFE